MKELKELRTLNAKIFDTSDEPGEGNRRLVARHLNPMHYDNDGVLEDIDMTVENGGVHKCGYDVDLYPDKIGYHGTAPDGKAIELELLENYVEPTIDGNKVTYPNVSQNVDLQIIFLPTMIRVNRILKAQGAKKRAQFRVKREEGIKGKLLNLGADSEGKKTELQNVEHETGNPHEKLITQTWSGKVAVMNKDTRKKEWSAKPEDIKYPVTIDPTSTFSIAANADDGGAEISKFTFTSVTSLRAAYSVASVILQNSSPPSTFVGKGGWVRFTGITIPQSATINSAILNFYGGVSSGSATFNAKVDSRQSPGNPTSAWGVINPANVVSGSVVKTVTNTTTFAGANHALIDLNVTSLVQALVNSYEYTNGEMVFYANKSVVESNIIYLYMRDRGTSKDAELVINFTAAGPSTPTDKTTFHHG